MKKTEINSTSEPVIGECNDVSLHESKNKVQGRNVKKKVGRPKKSIDEKVVKAPGMCQICGGLYVGLKYHMFVHDETPKFECDYCGRRVRERI